MKGFIVYPTYRIKENEAFIYLFGRLENGETFLTINKTKPYFFIRTKDLKKAKKHSDTVYEEEKTKFVNFQNEAVTKIVLSNPKQVPDLRDKWHENKIPTYEADIRFVYRYLIDNKIRGSLDIDGKHADGKDFGVDRIYTEPTLKPADWNPKLKVLSVDIESDKETEELYCIGLYSDSYKKCLVSKKGKWKNAETFENEQEVLVRFEELVRELDPDVITGWNVIDFDFNYLQEKFKKYKVPFTLGRLKEPARLRKYESYMRDSSADFPGRQVLDGMHLMNMAFIQLKDKKLNTAAEEFLDKGKLIQGTGRHSEITDAWNKDVQKLIDYNILDCVLVYDILEASGVLELAVQRSLITGMQLDRVKGSVSSFDNLYLSELRDRNIVAPSGEYKQREKRITGGYVMEGKPGIYDYVIVCDFKSLYPSIMRTFNIDPLAYARAGKNAIKAPNGAKFDRKDGIIPDLLQNLYEKRVEAKKQKNKLKSNAIKVLMNSIFGILANPNCRFYSFEMSNAITHFGQELIKLTAKKIEELGYKVIYSDTDSVFIDLDVSDYKKAEKIGKEIEDYVTEFFKSYIKEKYDLDSYLDLDFQKVYKRFIMPKVRTSEAGAKKRYAGLMEDKTGEKDIDFVGLEFVRRDWTDLAKKFQLEVLDKVFHKEDPSQYIKQFVKDLKLGKYDDLLVYRKALRKDVEDYTKTTPPHVKAAMKMEKIDSNIIEYVLTMDGPEPLSNKKHMIDYDHYIDKQLEPIANAILTFYKTNFDDVLKGTRQTKLEF